MTLGNQCEHGSLRRVCPICERDEEIASLKARLEAVRKFCDDYHQECMDTTGSDCSVDRGCERQDNCWVTRIRKALDTPTPGEGGTDD